MQELFNENMEWQPAGLGSGNVSEKELIDISTPDKGNSVPESEGFINEQQQQQESPTNIGLNNLLKGEDLIVIIDNIIAPIVAYGTGKIVKKKLSKTLFKANAEERAVIAPVIDECLKTIKFNFTNPWECFAFTAVAVYGGKMASAIISTTRDKPEEDVQESEDLNDIPKTKKRGRPRKIIAE